MSRTEALERGEAPLAFRLGSPVRGISPARTGETSNEEKTCEAVFDCRARLHRACQNALAVDVKFGFTFLIPMPGFKATSSWTIPCFPPSTTEAFLRLNDGFIDFSKVREIQPALQRGEYADGGGDFTLATIRRYAGPAIFPWILH